MILLVISDVWNVIQKLRLEVCAPAVINITSIDYITAQHSAHGWLKKRHKSAIENDTNDMMHVHNERGRDSGTKKLLFMWVLKWCFYDQVTKNIGLSSCNHEVNSYEGNVRTS